MLFHEAEVTKSLSNLYKQRYIVSEANQCRVINSNQALAERMEELAQQARRQACESGEFVEGLNAQLVEMPEPEPTVSLEEVKREAEEILANARTRAEQMIAEAQKKTEQIAEIAKAQGEREGYEAGRDKAAQELEVQRQQLDEQRQVLEDEYHRMRDALEPQILRAVSDVFEKVFHVQFDQNQEILLHLVRNAILKIESTRQFLVRVSEKNYQYMETHKDEILKRVGQNITLEIEADASMDEKQCVIETDSGFFECGIDVQLENLIKKIRSLSV